MSDCDNRYIDEFSVEGLGKNQEDAEKDFDGQLEKKREEIRTKTKCEEKTCPPTESEFGEGKRVCQFTYTAITERKCEEKDRTVKIYFKKEERWVERKRKRWECTQKFKYGCFCYRETIGEDE